MDISFFLAIAIIANVKPLEAVCSYEACPVYDPDALNIHLIAHSHDDVGWQRTVDQYFFQEVDHILSAVTIALKQNPERKYVQVETAFFKKWWDIQSNSTRQDVVDLANRGQLEFIGGGWSMNDEACAHYQSIIDQFSLGLKFLKDNIGRCGIPRVGWQIDPFGHSREHASISVQLGFDSLYFARIDYRDRALRKDLKTMELIWKASENLDSEIFTSVFYTHYSAPQGFCFDIVCTDDPIIDDEDSPDYNYRQKVEDFAKTMIEISDAYPTNNVLVTMGDDFRYQAAMKYFINMDRLIKGFELFPQTFNEKPIKVYYSTPSCYAKAVNQYLNLNNYNLQIKSDDFLPYADTINTYWTGYFTSRPASKGFERRGNNLLQITKQLSAITQGHNNEKLEDLKETMGVMQHHDAITGTEQQHVTDNYHLMLTSAMNGATELISSILSVLVNGEDLEFKSCLLANISHCPPSESDSFTVAVYNPLAWIVSSPITIPVNYDSWTISDPEGESVSYQISEPVNDYTFTDLSISSYNLEFVSRNLPALGYKIYTFTRAESRKYTPKASLAYGYDDINFLVDPETGLLSSVTMNNVTMEINQDFLYYSSANTSGAYIFVPNPNIDPQRVSEGSVKITPVSGDVYQGVLQEFSSWAKQTIKIYNEDRNYIEFDWTIGPIDIEPTGKEIITRYSSRIRNVDWFFTDSNSREMLNRTINFRSDYEYTNEQPVAANYYPVNSKISIKDFENDIELAILTDRSEGGTSLNEGQIEVMVHRACHQDDGRGVHEPLNEQEYGKGIIIRGRHYLILGQNVAAIQRQVALKKLLAPWPFITEQDVSGNLEQSFLQQPLPQNLHLLTLEPWNDDILVRLEHFLEKNEDEDLSQEVAIDLTNILAGKSIVSVQETTLGGNQFLDEVERLRWPKLGMMKKEKNKRDVEDLNIELAPMQIRTFVAQTEDILKTNK